MDASIWLGCGQSNFEHEIQKAKKKFAKGQSRDLFGHKKRVGCVAWNNSGDKLASGSIDTTVRIWTHVERKQTKDAIMELKGHTSVINVVSWNPKDPEQLATTSYDQTIRLWDVRSGKCTLELDAKGKGSNLAWSPDGCTIACGSKTAGEAQPQLDQLQHIDTRKGKVRKIIKFHYPVNQMSWNKNSTLFYLTTSSGAIELWNWPAFKYARTIFVDTVPILTLAINPNGKNFAVGSESMISLWDAKELVCLRTFANLNSVVRTLGISHDGQFLASGSDDLSIDISHVESGENVATIPTEAVTNGLAWHPSRLLLAYVGDDKDRYSRDLCTVKIFGLQNSDTDT